MDYSVNFVPQFGMLELKGLTGIPLSASEKLGASAILGAEHNISQIFESKMTILPG